MDRAVCRGTELLAIQEDQARKVVRRAVPVQLGGDVGIARGWGKGLAVRVDGMEHLRSDIGNRLARRSAEQGYRGVVLVLTTAIKMIFDKVLLILGCI